ncbi:hypothetical protein CFC21_034974 [Triticum aestivum]|uniref:Uncharacterized protein n=3 Tax=Triticum TaxID=4564 RepID=A0A9R0RFM9_TRITD|nr:BTB/POZ and MATH domain-containing protein 2-like [Triticum aestivum]KAF7022146.1 hypothetical protein CFC21_034974 [Triticum aestivum]VAH59717.1 unnamed protein product [Triticum turgidum subsp. durum]
MFSSSGRVHKTPVNTASTIVAEGVSGSHVLTVQGYSHTLGLGVCRSIPSGIFSVGGHTWKILYYPDGVNREFADWISFSLLLHAADDDDADDAGSSTLGIKVRCRFSLLDQVGVPVLNHTSPYRTTTCYAQGHGITSHGFIKREELENSPYLKADCFNIKCDVSVTTGIRTQPKSQQFITVPPSDMPHQLGRVLETGEIADVTFEVRGETFVAHRRLLAVRSSVFMVQLFGPMKEDEATCIRIDDMEARVFKMMLHFIYTDTLPNIDAGENTEMAQHLFVAADRYNLERLKLICVNMLCNHMNASMVATTLALAEQHDCDKLKKAWYKFLTHFQNLKAVIVSDGFKHLKSIRPNILEEILDRQAADAP